MALLPKKTYSRRNNDCSLVTKEKENVDPFDELLSSPLKQNVQFKPLSFWDGKVKDFKTNKESKNMKWELYETSNSEDNSPNNRKRNPRSKYSKCKGKTLPLRDKNQNVSTVKLCTRKSKSVRALSAVKNTGLILHDDGFGEYRSPSLDNALDFSKSPNPVFVSLHENCDEFKCISVGGEASKGNCLTEHGKGFKGTPYPLRIRKNDKKGTHSFQIELEREKTVNGGSAPHVTTAKKILKDLDDKTLTQIESEESENLTLNINETMEETSRPHHTSDDYFKFITVRRYFNNFNENNNIFAHSSVDLKPEYESPNDSQKTLKEINSPEDLTFIVCEEINIPGENSENINKSISKNISMDDSITSAKFFNDNNGTIVPTLSFAAYEGDVETSSAYSDDGDLIGTTFCGSEILRKSIIYVKDDTALDEETKSQSLLHFQTKNFDLDMSSFVFDNNNNLEDFTQKLSLGRNENSTGGAESSSASDENPFYLNDEESVINLLPNKNNTPNTDYNVEKESSRLDSSSQGLSRLTTEISNLTISNAAESGESSPEPRAEESPIQENNINYRDTKNSSVVIDLRNVTTKRKYHLNGNYQRNIFNADESPFLVNPLEEKKSESSPEREWGSNEFLEHSVMTNEDKTSFDWNKTLSFANPIFESTRVQDVSVDAGKFEKTMNRAQKMEESQVWLDHSYALKPGKKWLRSVSVLKQIRNGSMGCFESTRIKGRHFESFVKDMLEMQSGKTGWPTSMTDLTNVSTGSGLKKPFLHTVSMCYSDLESEDSLKDITFKGSNFSISCSDGTVLETSLINPTIKVIHPEEKPSGFGLEGSNLELQGADLNKSTGLSARDFILRQCGQDDVLPFEKYFNERTLKDCKKIGEGVYGEVFSSGDVVIKIIPIEGSEKVNGEPQKTFEEILSEVVIALKLSNLRKGEDNGTDGFSEVKRCWCVKGKYPEYLLRLWHEYDQGERGSENDSPVMFKDDQLYVILELANGGKDLESFVFSSASQSLSIFIQTAFSLAVAEKALEFEHRDLHWGNVLISETKDKYITVVLQNVEYKIPSKGVKVCIIDFTLSRICQEGFCIFNDLSVDPTLFTSVGDYQFEIYRMMLKEVKNDWSLFRPKTNIFWLHYTLDKMITMVRYKNKKAKLHKKGESDLKILKKVALDFKDTTDFVLSDSFSGVMERQ